MPLVSALRKRGKQVIGIGLRHTTSQSLVDLCDHYYYYDDLVKMRQQERTDKVGEWLKKALEELLSDRDRVPVSLFKERMRALSQGELDKIPEARESFRKLLEQYPQLVQVQLDGTTLYATRPQTGASPVIPTLPASALASPKATSTANAQASPKSAPPPAKTARAERKLSEPEVRQLLIQALSEMEQGKKHVRAGLLKERLYALSNQTFDEI